MGKRGLLAVLLGVTLLLAAGYWIRSGPEEARPFPEPIEQSATHSDPSLQAAAVAVDAAETGASAAQVRAVAAPDGTYRAASDPALLNEIANFSRMRSATADAARERVIARGDVAVAGVLAALEDVVRAQSRIDPTKSAADKKAYVTLLANQNHLMAIFAMLGDESSTGPFVAIADQMAPQNMLSPFVYDVLDVIEAHSAADRFAARIIADPNSDSMKLLAAMSHYWQQTPKPVAEAAIQHSNADLLLIRAASYQLASNGGFADRIMAQLVADIEITTYAQSGNEPLLNLLARLEQPGEFQARLNRLHLRPSLVAVASDLSRFIWAAPQEKEAMIPAMLQARGAALHAAAIQYLLEHGRADLLASLGLARVSVSKEELVAQSVDGFENMTRQQRLRYMSVAELSKLEALNDDARDVVVTRQTRRIANQLGYKFRVVAGAVTIESRHD